MVGIILVPKRSYPSSVDRHLDFSEFHINLVHCFAARKVNFRMALEVDLVTYHGVLELSGMGYRNSPYGTHHHVQPQSTALRLGGLLR